MSRSDHNDDDDHHHDTPTASDNHHLAQPAKHTVRMRDFANGPQSLNIKAEDTVISVNDGPSLY